MYRRGAKRQAEISAERAEQLGRGLTLAFKQRGATISLAASDAHANGMSIAEEEEDGEGDTSSNSVPVGGSPSLHQASSPSLQQSAEASEHEFSDDDVEDM